MVPAGSRSQTLTLCRGKRLGLVTPGKRWLWVASLQGIGLPRLQEPVDGWMETIDTTDENLSVIVGVAAVPGPALVIVIVYFSCTP